MTSSTTTTENPRAGGDARGRKPIRHTWAWRLARAERHLAREQECVQELRAKVREMSAEVRRLRRLLRDTDAGRLVEVQAQLERAQQELRAWRAGRR